MSSGSSAKLVVDTARLMPLGAENVQPTDCRYFVVFFVSLLLVAIERLRPLVGGGVVLVSVVVENGGLTIFLRAFNLALRDAQLLRNTLLHQFLLGHELRIATQQNIGTAARHVGCNRDPALASGLGDNFGFALMELGVQHDVVLEPFLLQ